MQNLLVCVLWNGHAVDDQARSPVASTELPRP
jgi:hypothetical protein